MGWLDERIIQHLYRSELGDELVIELPASEDAKASLKSGGSKYAYIGMLPFRVNLTFKIQFERNGLVAYKYDHGDGRPRVVSATRENYEKNVGNMPAHKIKELKAQGRLSEINKSVTTKGYQKAFEKVKEKRGGK
jgi:hypothetical protein